jgi:hypothetical protein
MNERIITLAAEAGFNRGDMERWDVTPLFEKFAELIVRECAEQSMSIGRYHDINGITPDLAISIAVGLKKHFGVEE